MTQQEYDNLAASDPQLYNYVKSQIDALPANNTKRLAVMLLPVQGASADSTLTLHSIVHIPSSGGSAGEWEPALPQDYPLLSTGNFSGAAPVAMKSNSSGGRYTVTYSIDGGPHQTFILASPNANP